jgi:hypothetical protein
MGKKVITPKIYERRKCRVVYKDPKCQYRVYSRRIVDEDSFQIRSLQPEHMCGRKYKNLIVNSIWIAGKPIDKFEVQPNMSLDVIQNEVKDKWKVDVSPGCMYREVVRLL